MSIIQRSDCGGLGHVILLCILVWTLIRTKGEKPVTKY